MRDPAYGIISHVVSIGVVYLLQPVKVYEHQHYISLLLYTLPVYPLRRSDKAVAVVYSGKCVLCIQLLQPVYRVVKAQQLAYVLQRVAYRDAPRLEHRIRQRYFIVQQHHEAKTSLSKMQRHYIIHISAFSSVILPVRYNVR